MRPPHLLAMLALVACSCQEPLQSGLTEEQADEIVVALHEQAIDARKVADERGARGKGYRVEVAHGDAARALEVMRAKQLPKRHAPGFEDMFGEAGLVPTRAEQRARLSAAVSGELARTLETMDGVLTARVHIAMPEAEPLGLGNRKPARPRASVMIRREDDAGIDDDTVRTLVAGAVQDMEREDVEVVQVIAADRTASARPLVQVGPIAVTASSATTLKLVLAAALLLLIALSLALLVVLARSRRLIREGSGVEEG